MKHHYIFSQFELMELRFDIYDMLYYKEVHWSRLELKRDLNFLMLKQ